MSHPIPGATRPPDPSAAGHPQPLPPLDGAWSRVPRQGRLVVVLDQADPATRTHLSSALQVARPGLPVLDFCPPDDGQSPSRPWLEALERWLGSTNEGTYVLTLDSLAGGSTVTPTTSAVLGAIRRSGAPLLPAALGPEGAAQGVRLGSPIPSQTVSRIPDDSALAAYLFFRLGLLRHPSVCPTVPPALDGALPVAPPGNPAHLSAELDRLPADSLLLSEDQLDVRLAEAGQIPLILNEIGRLREATFRLVGEGTGRERDLDTFDDDYLHLFVWHRQRAEIVGAYRLGRVDQIVARRGVSGLYTHSLFEFDSQLVVDLGPSLELGRSFVRIEYQRQYAALLSLWRGIGAFLARHPEYRHLFGPVSISRSYLTASWRLMANFLRLNAFWPELADRVRPRSPFHAPPLPGWDPDRAGLWSADTDELSTWVSEIEADGKGVPILLRQYLRLGGRILGFNIDPAFGSVLDGLIVIDTLQADPRLLRRYMGDSGLSDYLRYHTQTARSA